MLKQFRGALGVAIIGLVLGYLYGGIQGFALTAILAVLEVSLSFDNAVVNATILVKLSEAWQKIFLTFGVLIAVFGMRFVFPMLIVGITAHLSPVHALKLALDKGNPDKPGTYGYLLNQAHPAIAAFGGVFLLLLFLEFILEEREITWLSWFEKPLAKIGKLDQLGVVLTLVILIMSAYTLAPNGQELTVMVSGALGMVTFLVVNSLGNLFAVEEDPEAALEVAESRRALGQLIGAVGKQAFFMFLYLEVLDASFSFDGVTGAFAITSDPIIIAIGLGVGAMFIRSLTVYLVRKGTLNEYVYLEHGALWAIGTLAVLLLFTMRYDIPDVVTGLIGVALIGAALASSIVRNKHTPEFDLIDQSAPSGQAAVDVSTVATDGRRRAYNP